MDAPTKLTAERIRAKLNHLGLEVLAYEHCTEEQASEFHDASEAAWKAYHKVSDAAANRYGKATSAARAKRQKQLADALIRILGLEPTS